MANQGAIALLILAFSASLFISLVLTAFNFAWSHPSLRPVSDFIAGMTIAPYLFGFALIFYRLFVALVLVLYAARKFSPRRAYVIAALLGVTAPLAGHHLPLQPRQLEPIRAI